MVLKLLSARGQVLVEYILLILVTSTFVFYFFKSSLVKDALLEIGEKFKLQAEFSYRHAFYISGESRLETQNIPWGQRSMTNHPSYVGPGQSRFFGPAEIYPSR